MTDGIALFGTFARSRRVSKVDPPALRRAFALFVLAVAVSILLREGALVVRTIAPALPTNGPLVALALAMLVLGILAGRTSTQAETESSATQFDDGAGS